MGLMGQKLSACNAVQRCADTVSWADETSLAGSSSPIIFGMRLPSVLAILATVFFGFANVSPVAAACGGSPAVTTDKQDYGQFETAAISGSGFGCGQILSVLVTAPDGGTLSGNGMGSAGPDFVTTDGNGAFVLSYRLSGTLPGGGTYAGQFGTYTVAVKNSSGAVLASVTFTDGVGYGHYCALTTSGGVKCWGYNVYGQIGDGTTTNRLTPVDVTGLTSGVAQITLGFYHTCALLTSGGAKCWGYNAFGQIGDGTTTNRNTPVDVSALTSGVAQIRAGGYHTCAVTTSGGAKCWGYNAIGGIGDGTTTHRLTAVNVSGLTSGVAQIGAGSFHTCALTTGGGAKCWGYNNYGGLGDGTTTTRTTPVDVTGLTSGVAQISPGETHTCALTISGGAKCWGRNFEGELGDGTATNRLTQVDVGGLTSGVAQIRAGAFHTCALTTGGSAKCWGYNGLGQLGDGTTTLRLTQVDVSGLTSGVAQISPGYYHTCALTTGGGAKCWGYNGLGELGDGTTTTRLTQVNVSGLTSGVAALPDATSITIIDSIAPTASPTQSPAANAAGWNNTNVTVTWNWTDNAGGSGIDPANCTTSTVSSGEGAAVAVNATCKDLAGNTGNASYTVKVDKTNPTITRTATKADSTAYTPGAWTNQTVTVHYICADTLSGIATCTGDQVFSANGETSVSGTATDVAGNSAGSGFILVRIDKTNPTITASATKADSTAYTAGTWTNQTVTVHYTCGDVGGSGIGTCPADHVFSASGVTASTSGTATDNAGNSADASFGPIQIDNTNPTITASATKADASPYTAGTWTNQTVTVHYTCGDVGGSGVGTCPGDQVFSASGVTASTSGAATDNAGNGASASFGPIQIDKTNPTITASATKADATSYTAGTWTNQTVTVHYTCGDGGSGIATCPADQVLSATGVTASVSGTATDNVGNSASASFGPVWIDKTPPAITSSRMPAANAAGWNNSDVTVSFGCTDGNSGVVSPGSQVVLTSQGAGQSASGSCMDLAGNSSMLTVSSINIDKTAPGIANLGATPTTQQVGGVAGLTANLSDGLSGLNGWEYTVNGGTPVSLPATGSTLDATAQLTQSMPGVYSVCGKTFDLAGNSTAEECIYVVFYDPNGGFVTGGGWFTSLPGSYNAEPSLTGKATFGFVSKYLPGKSVPAGNTEFQFKAGNLNFKSTSYDWLVVAGARAQYQGSGTINGSGDYEFTLTAIDGQVSGGGGVDKFRLKIRQKGSGGVIYDNQQGDADSADPTTALGGGSIQIHK